MTDKADTQPINEPGSIKKLSAQLPYQKAVNSIKQVTLIRKITQQTLSPVIKNVQEHIAFLLQESKNLRIQTSTLQQVQATNLEYKTQIQHLKAKVGEIQAQLLEITQQNELKQIDNEKKLTEHQGLIEDLKRDGNEKADRIKKLISLNENQTELFGMTKEGMLSAIEVLKQQVATFYEKTIQINNENTQKLTSINKNTLHQSKQIELLQQRLTELCSTATLYTSQRQQIRNYLQQTIELSQQAVLREEYERDKKYQVVENELLKSYVERTVNEALTPQIRSFLPSLIHNIQLLQKLDRQIHICAQDITQSKQNQKLIHQKILTLEYSTKKNIEQKLTLIQKLSLQIETQTSSLKQQITGLSEQFSPKFESIQAIFTKHKNDSDQMFQTFIEKNRSKIYLAVLECKPPEVKEEENRIKLKLNTFQQQMLEITQKANERSDNVLNIGNSLDTKLELFQNRITKAKSDLKVQNDNIKKIVEGLNLKLQQSEHKNHQQSQVISKLLEVCMINTSLQIDQEYLQINQGKYGEQNQEIYISFHDGIIYEVSGQSKRNETVYRKKKLNKQILKRSLLKEEAKLIDFITERLKNWKWSDQKQRPSNFFIQNVYPTYENIFKENKQIVQTKRNCYEEKMANYKMPSINMLSQRRSKDSINPGNSTSKIQPINSKNLSKGSFDQKSKPKEKEKKQLNNTSLDIPRGTSLAQRIQAISHHSELHTTMDFHKPNRIKLKKIDQQLKQSIKDHDTVNPNTNNRYGLSKQTI